MRGTQGFTLVELLGTLAVVLILTAFAVPVYANIVDEARSAKSQRELEVIENALEQYKAEQGHYPDRLGHLITEGYLKSDVTFRSPWWSSANQIRYFYAIDGRANSATAYALGDPGRGARCGKAKETETSPHPKLKAGTTGSIPCGRHAHEPGWVFGNDDPTLDLYDSNGVLLPEGTIKSLSGFCCGLITEQ